MAAESIRACAKRRMLLMLLAIGGGVTGTGLAASDQRAPRPAPTPTLAPLPPAVIDDALQIGGDDLDARRTHTRMTVQVDVNGRGPFPFVVDSGADTSVVGANVARLLQLPAGTPVTLHGMTATSEVQRVQVDTLHLGQSDFHGLELPVLRERDLGGAGMVGIDALVNQRLMLDFERRTIRVEDARRPPPRLDGEIVVVARRRRGQLILTQARANGRPVNAVVDTGSEITIGNLALRDALMRRYGNTFTSGAVTGVTGVTVHLEMARIGELRLGPVVLRDVPIAFADVPPFAVFGLRDEPALLLGTDLMETFRRVSLDFRARKVRFQLRRCDAIGISISTDPFGDSARIGLSNGGSAACRRD
ncbi:aspartyl protease family protein [Sphingomonas sp.]|uniref:aspartyl protease family protein n=1 Tax=Sphingomonas sp. TaxID=28214 RepID=UPI003CC58E25